MARKIVAEEAGASELGDERLDLNTEAGQIYWGKMFVRLNEMAERFAQGRIHTQTHFDSAAVATEVVERIAQKFGLKGASDATVRRYFKEAAEKEEHRASQHHRDEVRRLSEENLARGWTDEAVAKIAASTRIDCPVATAETDSDQLLEQVSYDDFTIEGLANAIRQLPDDTSVEEWAKARGLVVRDEGVVPRGASWTCHDEAGVTEVKNIGVDRDPDEDDYDGSWLDGLDETVVLYARWSLPVVDLDGQVENVWVTTSTQVEPVRPDCDNEENKHKYSVEWTRGDGVGVRICEKCNHCGVLRVTRTHAVDEQGDWYRAVSYPDND